MNKQDILAEMAELKERLNNLEKQYNSLTPPNKRWRAERGDEYYYITERGFATYKTDCLPIDDARYELGNYFETREEAEFEIERRKVITELKEWATPISEFNWDDKTQKKYVLILENNCLRADVFYSLQIGGLYFESREIAENAIKTVGEERIIKYYFRRGEPQESEE